MVSPSATAPPDTPAGAAKGTSHLPPHASLDSASVSLGLRVTGGHWVGWGQRSAGRVSGSEHVWVRQCRDGRCEAAGAGQGRPFWFPWKLGSVFPIPEWMFWNGEADQVDLSGFNCCRNRKFLNLCCPGRRLLSCRTSLEPSVLSFPVVVFCFALRCQEGLRCRHFSVA